MKRILIGSLMLTAMLAPDAWSADLPVRATIAAPASTTVLSWTGFYWGVSAGYDGHRTKWTDVDQWSNCIVCNGGYESTIKSSGAIFGLNAGFSQQSGSVVFGIETDISFSTAKKTVLWEPEPIFVESQARFIGTTRFRLGVVNGNALVYATGGLAYGNGRAHWTENSGAEWDASTWYIGYAVGGGFEHVVTTHWTVRAEALYLGFASRDAQSVGTEDTTGYRMRAQDADIIVRIGLNYRFGS